MSSYAHSLGVNLSKICWCLLCQRARVHEKVLIRSNVLKSVVLHEFGKIQTETVFHASRSVAKLYSPQHIVPMFCVIMFWS